MISNGVDSDFVYRKLPKPKEYEGKFVILMIGRLSNEKRQDVLIRAVNQSAYREKIQLILAGQGPKYKALKKLGRQLKNPPVIRFFSREELLDVIAVSDLYVHAADAEIEAISCIEAFSGGLVPVIANSPKSATPQFALCDESLFEAGNSRIWLQGSITGLPMNSGAVRWRSFTANMENSILWMPVSARWRICLRRRLRKNARNREC